MFMTFFLFLLIIGAQYWLICVH